MPVFVKTIVLDVVQAVLNTPVLPKQGQEPRGRSRGYRQAGRQIAHRFPDFPGVGVNHLLPKLTYLLQTRKFAIACQGRGHAQRAPFDPAMTFLQRYDRRLEVGRVRIREELRDLGEERGLVFFTRTR